MMMSAPVMANTTFNSLPCFSKYNNVWDFQFETFIGLTTLSLLYKLAGAPVFTNITVPFNGNNVPELLRALNLLNVGTFYMDGLTIFNFTPEYEYGDINLS